MPTVTCKNDIGITLSIELGAGEALLPEISELLASSGAQQLLAGQGVCTITGLPLIYQEGLEAWLSAYAGQVSAQAYTSTGPIELGGRTGGLAAPAPAAKPVEPDEPTELRLEIQGVPSLADALRVFLVLCALQLTAEAKAAPLQTFDMATMRRFVALLNAARAPYYLRYLFSRNVIKDLSLFEALRPQLELPGMRLVPGHTQQHRFAAIKPHFCGGRQLVDIGCGAAYYLRRLGPLYARITGFEANAYVREGARRQVEQHGLAGKVRLFGAFTPKAFIPAGAHVLMTEVLEHMPFENASALMSALASQPAGMMVFTVPNRAFNAHYRLSPDEFRHYDHHWEPDDELFKAMTRKILGARWDLTFEGVGDAVDGVHSGLLCRATPKAQRPEQDWMQGISAETMPFLGLMRKAAPQ
jgi:2-polyprenyl-3-methyl-5-hydroxy-6-metoxy-1,4-benzoquinol methylase